MGFEELAPAVACKFLPIERIQIEAVHKIMDVMRAAYAKSWIQSQHVSNYTRGKRSRKALEYCERKACIICKQHFSILLNRFMVAKMFLKCTIHSYAFPNFCRQISRPLVYGVCISSKASVARVALKSAHVSPRDWPLLRSIICIPPTWDIFAVVPRILASLTVQPNYLEISANSWTGQNSACVDGTASLHVFITFPRLTFTSLLTLLSHWAPHRVVCLLKATSVHWGVWTN